MKKTFKHLFMGAIAFMGIVGFTACSDKDDPTNDDGSKGILDKVSEVLVDFVLNISSSDNAETRQLAGEAQVGNGTASGAFRGMVDTKLLAYSLMDNGNHSDGKLVASDAEVPEKVFELDSFLGQNEITDAQSSRIMEMSLPIGTNALMLYGKAPAGTSIATNLTNAGYTTKDVYGSTTMNVNTASMGDTRFSLEPRIADKSAVYHAVEQVIGTVMTRLLSVGLYNYTANGVEYEKKTVIHYPNADSSVSYEPISWADYKKDITAGVATYDNSPYKPEGVEESTYVKPDMMPLEEQLADMYYELTHKTATEIRAGAASAICLMIQDLWTAVRKIQMDPPLNEAEAIAQAMAERIETRINAYFTGTVTPEQANVTNVRLATISTLKSKFSQYELPTNVFTTIEAANITDINNFPISFGIPKGAAQIDITPYSDGAAEHLSKRFSVPYVQYSYVQDLPFNDMVTGNPTATTSIEKYLYPAELTYFGNSPIRVSDNTYERAQYPKTVATWDKNNESWGNMGAWTEDSHVLSTTHSVAMRDQIRYSVAMLETKVTYASSTLEDNKHNMLKRQNVNLDEPNNTFNASDTPFQLTGILIGGTNRNVGWNYLAGTTVTAATDQNYGTKNYNFDYMVYDHYLNTTVTTIDNKTIGTTLTIPATGTTDPVYTMLWDNYNPGLADNAQPAVYVALEFYNNGKNFWARDNMVRAGQTFYVIGELKLTGTGATLKDGSTITWPTNYVVPPYADDAESSKEIDRVFIQDFMTKATFKIGQYSLQYAYVTIPDLRTGQVSLGLSVDLSWNKGYEFETYLGGNTPIGN